MSLPISRLNDEVKAVRNVVTSIFPLDKIEESHINGTLSWIDGGNSIFRIEKPDVPKKHLV